MSLSFALLICLCVAVALSLALLVYLYSLNRAQSRDQAAHADGVLLDLASELDAELSAADEAREASSNRAPISD